MHGSYQLEQLMITMSYEQSAACVKQKSTGIQVTGLASVIKVRTWDKHETQEDTRLQ